MLEMVTQEAERCQRRRTAGCLNLTQKSKKQREIVCESRVGRDYELAKQLTLRTIVVADPVDDSPIHPPAVRI